MRSSLREPSVISYNSAISACAKGQQWEQASRLLVEMRSSLLEPSVISYNSAISACAKGQQWEHASRLLLEMKSSLLEPSVISYDSAISARAKGQQWEQASRLLLEMSSLLEPSVIAKTQRRERAICLPHKRRRSQLDPCVVVTSRPSAPARSTAAGAGHRPAARDAALPAGSACGCYIAAISAC